MVIEYVFAFLLVLEMANKLLRDVEDMDEYFAELLEELFTSKENTHLLEDHF